MLFGISSCEVYLCSVYAVLYFNVSGRMVLLFLINLILFDSSISL